MSRLLVVVHPGSLLGSADFNLGSDLAEGTREMVARTLDRHEGHVLVVDGGFDDEFPDYPELEAALVECVERNAMAGFLSERFHGPDDALPGEHFTETLPAKLREIAATVGADTRVALTGAWYHPDDGGGCVGATRDIAKEAGFRCVDVLDCCAVLGFGQDDGYDDEPEADEDTTAPSP